ncbi:TUL1 (YKL034W) [Zygosaccharomyces parabailii]|uniref:RING-type E3 ubiquitin transferase n=1 Tax=Zygosaccharomyces bailii (strain CLIB 213 / ATCC 58445 / CBS 680 / BCRC 21525 / NBRC 1098 / NCYC 1416 / NRRL Y-2227) TaxID=1333698 RepID=A0A8J2T740_ZYGB2|nr:TUL1 (YKL034W) [Zygosaccharomyces parabailii]CDF90099.1 ZYBA0S06-00518g1_1 [Zygosaccharomyces bailii CLIB 213]
MEIDGNTLLIIIIILFLFFSTPGGDGVSSQYEYNQLQTLKSQFSSENKFFQDMNCNEGFRNITGFKLSYQDVLDDPHSNATYPIPFKDYESWGQDQEHMILPQSVIDKVKHEVWVRGQGHDNNIFPPNITSNLLGRMNLVSNSKHLPIPMPVPRFYEGPSEFSDVAPPSGETYPSDWPAHGELHNVTFDSGELTIQLTHVDKVSTQLGKGKKEFFNSQTDKWKFLNLRISFSDNSEHEKHSFPANAIYDVRSGRILAMTESAKFHSLFAFPHYMNLQEDAGSEDMYESLKKSLDEYWDASNFVDTLTMTSLQEFYDEATLKCEYLAFFQLTPWNQYNRDQLKMIDDELNWPLGRPANLSSLPLVTIKSGLLYSPDCGVELRLHDVKGERYELKMRSIRTHLLVGVGLFAAQIYLFLCQMHHTNTPSSVNKISVYCFSMINLVDGSLATIYLFSASIFPELYLPLVVSAFTCSILASVFEIRYLISVYASQINERNVGIMTLLRGGNTNVDDTGAGNTFIPDESSISGTLHARFFVMLVSFTFLTMCATLWPRKLRMTFEYMIIMVLNSYWLPQIFRNAIKGTLPRRNRLRNERMNEAMGVRRQNKMPLLWKFILGTTLIRTLPVVYVFTYSSNVFRHHKNVRFVVILCLWLLFQIAVLYSQDILGSRWFVPKLSIPEGYSYHKSMTAQDLLEHGSSAKYTVDCAICVSEVPVYVEDVPGTHKVDEQTYMVTPCGHIFHTQCLENWMSYKLQCPVCRAALPPL